MWVSTTTWNTSVTFINITSQHLSVKHTLQQMADLDYGNMQKTLLSISALCSLPLCRPCTACGKLRPVFLVYCGWTTVASPVCCCIWMCTLAVSNHSIKWAHCKLGYRAAKCTYQATELVRKKLHKTSRWETPACVVVYTQNRSGIKCSLSRHFCQIGYHYKLQDSAKMCSVLKCHQLKAAKPPDPLLGALPTGPPGVWALPTLLDPHLQTTCDAAASK